VLFDASALPVEENQRQTVEGWVAEGAEVRRSCPKARSRASPESRTASDRDTASQRQSLAIATTFVRDDRCRRCSRRRSATLTASTTPRRSLDYQRITDLVTATGIPMALHGGSGLSREQFQDLIARGWREGQHLHRVKVAYMTSSLEHLEQARATNKWDPPVAVPPHPRRRQDDGRRAHRDLRQRWSCMNALIFDCDGVVSATPNATVTCRLSTPPSTTSGSRSAGRSRSTDDC